MKNIALAICLIVVSAGMFYSSLQSVSYYFKDKPEVEYLVLAIFLLWFSWYVLFELTSSKTLFYKQARKESK